MMTLAEIGAGQTARVETVTGSDTITLRLLEMGLTPGCEVHFVAKAPLGDPLEFDLRGYRLSLRRTEASRVHVSLV
jgi:ferrous iron transport protein A